MTWKYWPKPRAIDNGKPVTLRPKQSIFRAAVSNFGFTQPRRCTRRTSLTTLSDKPSTTRFVSRSVLSVVFPPGTCRSIFYVEDRSGHRRGLHGCCQALRGHADDGIFAVEIVHRGGTAGGGLEYRPRLTAPRSARLWSLTRILRPFRLRAARRRVRRSHGQPLRCSRNYRSNWGQKPEHHFCRLQL